MNQGCPCDLEGREVAMWRRVCQVVLLATLVGGWNAHDARGATLHWEGTGTDLWRKPAIACTLVVECSPEEPALPSEWRLLWVADGVDQPVVEIDALGVKSGLSAGPAPTSSEWSPNTTYVNFAA